MAAEQLRVLTHPLHLFPAEIWTMMLSHVTDMEDGLRFFQAFPEMTALMNGKKFPWLIGGVLPFLMSKYLNFSDIRSCRLVSKSWKTAIDTALETHPDRLPYQSSRVTRLTETHFGYHSLPKIQTKLRRFLRSTRNVNSLDSNPFPGRYLDIVVKDSKGRGAPFSVYLYEVAEMLEKFGHYIWYVRFLFQLDSDDEYQLHELIHGLMECLLFLPNLKSLKIDTQPSRQGKNVGMELDTNSLISIPAQLEALDFTGVKGVHPALCRNLLTTLGNHVNLQKLEILLEHWDTRFGAAFPNLTELHLDCSSFKNPTDEHLAIITEILWEMPSNFCGKLRISNGVIKIHELLQVLSPFQIRIRALDLENSQLLEDSSAPSFDVSILSVRELKMCDHISLQYNFLTSFQSLEYLTVQPSEKAIKCAKVCLLPGKQVRGYLYARRRKLLSLAQFNVWKKLPALKILRARNRLFVRECGNRMFHSYRME